MSIPYLYEGKGWGAYFAREEKSEIGSERRMLML